MKKSKGRHQHPILVAVDFSDDSEAALLWAIRHADNMKAGIALLHVVHEPGDQPGFYKKDDKDLMRPLADIARKMMRKFLKSVGKKAPKNKALRRLDSLQVSGVPAKRIVEVAEKLNARLIVVGTQGRSEIASLIIGSTAEQVVRLSPIPVVTVKSAQKKKKK